MVWGGASCDGWGGMLGRGNRRGGWRKGRGRWYSASVAHAVWCDDAEAEGEEEWDLVAPAHGEVGEAVDEEDGAFGWGRGCGVEVAWGVCQLGGWLSAGLSEEVVIRSFVSCAVCFESSDRYVVV